MALFPMLGLGPCSSFGPLAHAWLPCAFSTCRFAGLVSLGRFSFFGVRVSLASLHSRTVAPEPVLRGFGPFPGRAGHV